MADLTPTRYRNKLRTDILAGALILAFTAVPTAVRWPSPRVLHGVLSLDFYLFDIIPNVVGYVPLGLLLARRGLFRALLCAGLVSLCAEASQLFCMGRDSSVVDVATNLMGAGLGILLARGWQPLPDEVLVTPWRATIAAAVAAAFVLTGGSFTLEAPLRELRGWVKAPPWMSTNPRGAGSSGTLEAQFSFDAVQDGVVLDASRNRLSGNTVRAPLRIPGVRGSAISLDGNQWVNLASPVALRLQGSMTLSAWVRATAFPKDDAAIISSLTDNEFGYQLDLTDDQGPRTIGFKVASSADHLMARYGRTPLLAGRWYHVAGVYNAAARTLDVYLDGHPDNGCLAGPITERQQPSAGPVTLGRRAGMAGFGFIGAIDEARIQSRASSGADIAAEVDAAGRIAAPTSAPSASAAPVTYARCADQTRLPRAAGPFVTLGMLIACACAGLWRARPYRLTALGACLATGYTARFWSSGAAAFAPRELALLCVVAGALAVLLAGSRRVR